MQSGNESVPEMNKYLNHIVSFFQNTLKSEKIFYDYIYIENTKCIVSVIQVTLVFFF